MKVSARLFCTAVAVIALFAFAAEARAQFPICSSGQIVIRNPTAFDALVCIKYLGCFRAPAGTKTAVNVLPGTRIVGIAGAANITYTWTPFLSTPPYQYWIQSVQLQPSNNCFNIYSDGDCLIDLQLTAGPPCLNP